MSNLSADYKYSDFDVFGGCCYLTCLAGPYSVLCFPCMYMRMTSQEVEFVGNRLHFRYDCCIAKEDKLIPLDRIQDANIAANFCSRLCGVSILSIQTANGSPTPEALIIAPRDAEGLRSMIMDRRDQLVGAGTSSGLDGPVMNQVHAGGVQSTQQLGEIRNVLERIERLVEKGVDKFQPMEVK
eukprot:gene19780-14378_t